jgi:hypothetical protein
LGAIADISMDMVAEVPGTIWVFNTHEEERIDILLAGRKE